MKSVQAMSASVEDYLTALYRLTASGSPVGPSRLAEFMGLSVPSITIMMRRLAEQGLVVKDGSRGIVLSPEGEEQALGILRRHRLSERFLVDKLGLDWGVAHAEAHRFEHALSPLVADALERFLGNPSTCPHGNPIPRPGGGPATADTVSLAELRLGDRAVVRCVEERSAELLAWAQTVGLVPGVEIAVQQVDPSGDTMLVGVGRGNAACGSEVARSVRVEKLEAR